MALSFEDKIKPVQGSVSFADKIVPVNQPAPVTAPAEAPGILDKAKQAFAPIDEKLSDLPGNLGFVGSGAYNAAKGVASLVGSGIWDLFHAINHTGDAAYEVGNFVADELKGGAKPESLDTLGHFVQSTVGSKGLLGVAQLPGKVAFSAIHPEDENAIDWKNAAGTALNGALTALTFGEGNLGAQGAEYLVKQGAITKPVGELLKKAAVSYAGRAVQSGALAEGFNAASNLQEGAPIAEGAKQAFGMGLALPTVLSAGGAILKKVSPSISISEGATQLKKAIGFRGGNSKEAAQFEKAAPVVFEDLKKTGFKLDDAKDPNNLIRLHDAMEKNMSDILKERMSRIKATGGDATVSGDLAAAKIRSLVPEGSVEDLTTPGVRDRLETIAKNFEGKRYDPVTAQKMISDSNTGFTWSDNPGVGKQIKMAISQAFTPELDRIVSGSEEIKLDSKGKPVPQAGGTAELNKKWSAYKSIMDQLDKKMTVEDRKAINSLPDRLTGAEIAGKVGEAAGNPLVIPQKIGGAAFEYVANKIMGDRNNINYRIYRAFNGSSMSRAIVEILNKFQKAGDLIKFLEQNPLIQNILEKILPSDASVQAETNLIPKNGGFIKNPFGKEIVKFSQFHPEDQKFLVDVANRIKGKEPVSFREIERAKETLKHYEFNAPEAKTKLADVILNASNSAEENAMFSQMNSKLGLAK